MAGKLSTTLKLRLPDDPIDEAAPPADADATIDEASPPADAPIDEAALPTDADAPIDEAAPPANAAADAVRGACTTTSATRGAMSSLVPTSLSRPAIRAGWTVYSHHCVLELDIYDFVPSILS